MPVPECPFHRAEVTSNPDTIESLRSERDVYKVALLSITNGAPHEEPEDPESGNYDDSRDYGMALAYFECAEVARAALSRTSEETQ